MADVENIEKVDNVNEESADTDKSSDIGKFARHPLRTMGGALMIGTAMGASMMAAKKGRSKSPMQRWMGK